MTKLYLFPTRARKPPERAPCNTVEFRVMSYDVNGRIIHGPESTYSIIAITLGLNGLHETAAYADGFMYLNCFGLDGVE